MAVGGATVSPRDVVAAVLPDPATLGSRMTGTTCAGTLVAVPFPDLLTAYGTPWATRVQGRPEVAERDCQDRISAGCAGRLEPGHLIIVTTANPRFAAGASARGGRGLRLVVLTTLLTGLMSGVWALWLAQDAGDLAAQYAWASFVRRHPGAVYNLSWYGGMHTASYSVLSPYVMAWAGVRTTGVLAAVASAVLGALLLARSGIPRPAAPALLLAVALWCNLAAGRITFLLGAAFALAAAVVVLTGTRWRGLRASVAALLGVVATLCSPVAGLFVEVLAAALFLTGRRRRAYPLAAGPAVVVAVTSLSFPFSGVQPFPWYSALATVAVAVAVAVLVPRPWRTVRAGAWVYAAGAALCWALPTPIGSNVERLALLAAPAVLAAAAGTTAEPGRTRTTGRLGAAATAVWMLAAPVMTIVTNAVTPVVDARPLLTELRSLDALQGRVEVVPMRTHWEASGIAPAVELARGWNRQVDVERNPLFYDGTLTAASYGVWLRRWAVGYVVLPTAELDSAGFAEAQVIGTAPAWLPMVWQDAHWRVYRVLDTDPMASAPAAVGSAGPASVTVHMPRAGSTVLRTVWSPWLTIDGVDTPACLTQHGDWTELVTTAPGTFTISASYAQGRGTPCPTPPDRRGAGPR
ncbi:hypothetical protein [Actinoplanes sp. N902-109]|uniref:hypothetical protein n=1 Tax=Actinoplanes sp. (strain N902-109) TaxID=649831 RepID=UPI000329628F|nr:hypothetical protein [Actinoplanes sp. N902-109]AGL17711.1 putative integral membrane protein [Actinoplanes sp. N902-109]